MSKTVNSINENRNASFGTNGLTLIDPIGIWLSQRAIRSQIRFQKKLDVLEIGCGYKALNLISISKYASSMTGIDFNLSPGLANVNGFRAIEGSYEESLPHLNSQQFDLVMILSVLEHVDDPDSLVRFCRDRLNPSGTLLINVPTWRGKAVMEFLAFKLGVCPKEEMEDHRMYYDKRDLWPLLVKAGFKPSHIKMRYHKLGFSLWASVRKESI